MRARVFAAAARNRRSIISWLGEVDVIECNMHRGCNTNTPVHARAAFTMGKHEYRHGPLD